MSLWNMPLKLTSHHEETSRVLSIGFSVSPPIPLAARDGLPRLLLSSLGSPPPTRLWGLARSCISIDLQEKRRRDKTRQLWFLKDLRSIAPTAGNLQPPYIMSRHPAEARGGAFTQIPCVHKRKPNGPWLATVFAGIRHCLRACRLVHREAECVRNYGLRCELQIHRMFCMCGCDTRWSESVHVWMEIHTQRSSPFISISVPIGSGRCHHDNQYCGRDALTCPVKCVFMCAYRVCVCVCTCPEDVSHLCFCVTHQSKNWQRWTAY